MRTIIAHRGIINNCIENSLKSFTNIFKYKYNNYKFGVEFDVNITKDKKLLIYHDEFINNELVNNLTYETILKINKDVPLLEDVLKTFEYTDYILDIELKNYPKDVNNYCELFIILLRKYCNRIKYFVSTFDNTIYEIMKKNNIECYRLSEDFEDYNDIIHYSQEINDSVKGIYTIYDNNYDENNLYKIKNKPEIIITDNVDKIINFLDQ